MPLYEVLVINSHIARFDAVRDLVRSTATNVMNQGGVVRSINFWGTRNLPQRMRSHKQWYTNGDYWTMHYDASPALKSNVESRLRQDPRVIRWTTLKMGEKLEDICEPKWLQTITTNPALLGTNKLAPVEKLPEIETLGAAALARVQAAAVPSPSTPSAASSNPIL